MGDPVVWRARESTERQKEFEYLMQSLQIVARVLDDYDKKVSLFLSLSLICILQANDITFDD